MEMSRWLYIRASIFLTVLGFLKRMTIGVRAILVDGDKVLLIKHSYLPGWHFPGGGVDHKETIEEGMIRETVEETGYRVKGKPEFLGHYLNTIPPSRDHVAVYVCREFEVERVFEPNKEIIEMGWFDITNLPQDTSKATLLRLAELFENRERVRAWKD